MAPAKRLLRDFLCFSCLGSSWMTIYSVSSSEFSTWIFLPKKLNVFGLDFGYKTSMLDFLMSKNGLCSRRLAAIDFGRDFPLSVTTILEFVNWLLPPFEMQRSMMFRISLSELATFCMVNF
jgi:hypothetical protein